jgi:hypothetical protein
VVQVLAHRFENLLLEPEISEAIGASDGQGWEAGLRSRDFH